MAWMRAAQPAWRLSKERVGRKGEPRWIVELVQGDQVLLAAAGGQGSGFGSGAAAAQFANQISRILPSLPVEHVPSLEQRIVDDVRAADARREEEAARERLAEERWQEAARRAEAESWTDEDWDRFFAEDDRHEPEEDEWDDDDWDDLDPVTARRSFWQVREGEGRPQAILFLEGAAIFSTAGLLRPDDVTRLIEWLQSDEASRIPVVRGG